MAAEVKAALEGLPTVGGVTVTKEYLGFTEVLEDTNFPVWTVTFDGECSFAGSEWAFCPANIGDLEVSNSKPRPTIQDTRKTISPGHGMKNVINRQCNAVIP